MAKTQELLYAIVGAGDFTVQKIANIGNIADRESNQKLYNDFVKRGRSLSKRIGSAAPTKQAIAQTKTARSQVKAAVTSITKAVNANANAARAATRKVAKAS